MQSKDVQNFPGEKKRKKKKNNKKKQKMKDVKEENFIPN